MTQIQPFLPQSSPFDAIRRVRPDGSEFWLARELMIPLGYMRWDGFLPAIERATITAQNSGVDIASEFAQVVKVRRDPKLGDQQRYDYELSRFACYLTAMNGDPRKPEIAAAQTYFAVRTREAETAQPRQLSRKQLAQMVIDAEEALEVAENRALAAEHRAIEMAPAARMAEELMSAEGDYSVRQAAQILDRDPSISTGQNRLFKKLQQIGWLDAAKIPYQYAINRGWVAVRATDWEDQDGIVHTSQQVRVTPRGLAELHQRLGGSDGMAGVVAA